MNYSMWILYPIWCICVAWSACFLTQTICPSAVGSGLPEMKTVLSGTVKPSLLSFNNMFAKLVGLTLATLAGLSVGKEGPFVHIAIAIASQLMRLSAFRYSVLVVFIILQVYLESILFYLCIYF